MKAQVDIEGDDETLEVWGIKGRAYVVLFLCTSVALYCLYYALTKSGAELVEIFRRSRMSYMSLLPVELQKPAWALLGAFFLVTGLRAKGPYKTDILLVTLTENGLLVPGQPGVWPWNEVAYAKPRLGRLEFSRPHVGEPAIEIRTMYISSSHLRIHEFLERHAPHLLEK